MSYDPDWWPFLNQSRISSYLLVASSAVVVYDWVLTFGQEVEQVWKRRWSLMTVLYICVRYIGVICCVTAMLWYLDFMPISNAGCTIIWFVLVWTNIVVNAMLGVIMMTRIHAMYGRSKKMLIFLIVVLLASMIGSGVMTLVADIGVSGEEGVFSGAYQCAIVFVDIYDVRLHDAAWIPTIVWELLAFCLAAWIVVKHWCGLRQHGSTGSTIRDSFTVLIKSHMLYFVAFAAVACLYLGPLSPELSSSSVGSGIYFGILNFTQPVQMFVLGPRLVLSIRQYHAELVAKSDEGTSMTAIAFQERRQLSTSGGV
jgi:hypothetical protein